MAAPAIPLHQMLSELDARDVSALIERSKALTAWRKERE
jgi:hypothetical protein